MQSTSTKSTTANPRSPKPTVTLADIQNQFSSIYTAARDTNTVPQMSQTEYLEIYTSVCNFGMASKAKKTDAWNRQGKALFTWLDAEIRTHTRIVRDDIFGVEGLGADGSVTFTSDAAREVLNKYVEGHAGFEGLSSLVGNLLGSWDRHWLRREWHEKKTRVANVKDMHRLIWKEEVLGLGDGSAVEGNRVKRLGDAMTKLKGLEGAVEELDEKCITDIRKSLSDLGVILETQGW